LSALPGFCRAGTAYKARCPSRKHKNGDQHPSLSIDRTADGTILLYCHHCRDVDPILEALGLRKRDLFPISAPYRDQGQIVGVFDYRSATGSLLYQSVRFEKPASGHSKPGKTFRQRKPDGSGGWAWTTKDVTLVPYNLPALIEADPSVPVLVLEGEGKVNAATTAGFLATCNVAGAGKWRDSYSEVLRGRHCIVLPDNDEAGKKHATEVVASLKGKAASVSILHLPDLPEKGDIIDWLKKPDNTPDLLQQFIRVAMSEAVKREEQLAPAATRTPTYFTASELLTMELREPKMIIPDLLPEGLGICGGKPKMGKSWMWLGISVAVATGGRALGRIAVEQGEVLYLALEDNPRRLQKRLKKIISDTTVSLHNLTLCTEWPRLDSGGLSQIQTWLTEHPDARLVVIDTWARIKGRQRTNGSQYDEDYASVEGLQHLAGVFGVAILIITHLRKLDAEDPLDTLNATLGFSGGADSILILKRERGRHDANLFVSGRDVEEQDLALKWDADLAAWSVIGEAEEYRRSQARQEVIDVLRKEGKPMPPKDLAEILDKNPGTIRKLMWEMSKDGELTSEGGKYSISTDR
jgi:hypothetical protein